MRRIILIFFILASFSSFSYEIERSSACERNVNDILIRFGFGDHKSPSENVVSIKNHRQGFWGDRLAEYRVGDPGVEHDRLKLYKGKKEKSGAQKKIALYFDGNKLTGIETSGGKSNYSIKIESCEVDLISTFNEKGQLHSNTNRLSCLDINDYYHRASKSTKYAECNLPKNQEDIYERNACLRRLGFNQNNDSIASHQEDLCKRLTFQSSNKKNRRKPKKRSTKGI